MLALNAGRFRAMGGSSPASILPIRNSNEFVAGFGRTEILPSTKLPVFFGACTFDPQLDIDRWLDRISRWGFSGGTNFPSVIHIDDYRRSLLEKCGLGYAREIELLVKAAKRGLMTIAYTRTQSEARRMVEAGTQAICINFNLNRGVESASDPSISLSELAARTSAVARVAQSVDRNVICLLGGGPITKSRLAWSSIQRPSTRLAKSARGADMLVVYSTGLSRLMGLPTSRIGDSNARTLELAAEIRNVVSSVPVVGGIEAWDPLRLDLDALLDKFWAAGFSGVINYPTISTMGDTWRDRRGRVGLGFEREVELIALARKKNIFSLAYVASPQDAKAMASAGADCIVPHVGATRGGLVGHEDGQSIKEAIRRINEINAAALTVRSDVLSLCHGGAIAEPEDTIEVYRTTACVGFVGASSIERLPIERAVKTAAADFKAVPLPQAH